MTNPRSGQAEATAVALGGIGAVGAWALSFPAPFLTGPALLVSVMAVLGVPVALPNVVRNAVFVVIGMTMGAGVTPETLATAAQWPFSILTLFAALIAIMLICTRILARMFQYDPQTAVLASAPGHLSFVLGLSTETKADIPVLSIVQTMRVLTLTLAVPAILAVTNADLEPRFSLEGVPMAAVGLTIVAALSVALGFGFTKLRVPAAFLIGGLFVSAGFHVTETVPGVVPQWLSIPAFALMGVLIGTRFNGISWAKLRQALGASGVVTGVALLVSGAAALVVAQFIAVEPAHLLIAFAPGGLETMAAMGIMLGANPAFIAAHHVLRILFLTVMIPLMLNRTTRS
ncbi:MAG: AbrB family transcriptional regulator [Pseudomonadota bacterium]